MTAPVWFQPWIRKLRATGVRRARLYALICARHPAGCICTAPTPRDNHECGPALLSIFTLMLFRYGTPGGWATFLIIDYEVLLIGYPKLQIVSKFSSPGFLNMIFLFYFIVVVCLNRDLCVCSYPISVCYLYINAFIFNVNYSRSNVKKCWLN